MITIKNLHNMDAQHIPLDISSLEIETGEITAFIGPVGSGITELFEMLIGETRPSLGDIRVLDMDPYMDHNKLKPRLGIMPAENQLYERFSVRSNLEFHCQLYSQSTENIERVLESVGLRDHFEVRVDRLSSSMARRLAFARCIAHRPDVIYLFQPFLECDQSTLSVLSDLIVDLAENKATVVIFDSEASSLSRMGTTIYRLENGHLMRESVSDDLSWKATSFKIPVKQDGRVVLIDPSKIFYISIEGEQTFIHTPEGATSSHLTISDLEKRLSHNGFFRAHRGYLVNLQHVNAVIPYTRDSFTLTLDSSPPAEIPLSKKAAQKLRQLLDY